MAYGVQDAGLRTDALAGSELRDILGVSLGGVGATGGVLAPASMERALLDEIKKQNVIRQLADVRSSGSDIEIPLCDRPHEGISGRRGRTVHRVEAGLRQEDP